MPNHTRRKHKKLGSLCYNSLHVKATKALKSCCPNSTAIQNTHQNNFYSTPISSIMDPSDSSYSCCPPLETHNFNALPLPEWISAAPVRQLNTLPTAHITPHSYQDTLVSGEPPTFYPPLNYTSTCLQSSALPCSIASANKMYTSEEHSHRCCSALQILPAMGNSPTDSPVSPTPDDENQTHCCNLPFSNVNSKGGESSMATLATQSRRSRTLSSASRADASRSRRRNSNRTENIHRYVWMRMHSIRFVKNVQNEIEAFVRVLGPKA